MLIKMDLSRICGTDKHSFKGETKQYAGTESAVDMPFPMILRHENLGVVTEIAREAKTRLLRDGQTHTYHPWLPALHTLTPSVPSLYTADVV